MSSIYEGFANDFAINGYLQINGLLKQQEVADIGSRIGAAGSPGNRLLLDEEWCCSLAMLILTRLNCLDVVPAGYVAILCTYFEKTAEVNWGVAPHRDTSIPVARKFDADGWGNWTEKQGIIHAQPPLHLLRQLFAVRLSLDAQDYSNGALHVVSGSHVSDVNIDQFNCIHSEAGDALLMSPALLHSSKKSVSDKPRRVLHFLFAPADVSEPIEWRYTIGNE